MKFILYGQNLLFSKLGSDMPWVNMSFAIGALVGIILESLIRSLYEKQSHEKLPIDHMISFVGLILVMVGGLLIVTYLYGDKIVKTGDKYSTRKRQWSIMCATVVDVLLLYGFIRI